jgi:hypothetical protein
MTAFKTVLLAAVATAALANPSLAQNFQGFGAPSWVTESYQTQQNRPVVLKSQKVKHQRHTRMTAPEK